MEALLDVLGALSKDEMYFSLLESIHRKEIEKEDWRMCYVIDEYMRRGMERGMAQGMEQGMAQGRRCGFEGGVDIIKFILESVRSGYEKDKVLESIVKDFEISPQVAGQYYNLVAGN